MFKILIPLLLLAMIVVMAKRYLKNSPEGEEKSRKITITLMGFALVMVLLAMTGRLHWVGAALAALAPAGKMLLASAVDYFRRKKLDEYVSQAGKSDPSGKMTEQEALNILALKTPYTKEQVVSAHRKLMQKMHPDRGGSDYLAARINEAKEVLIKA